MSHDSHGIRCNKSVNAGAKEIVLVLVPNNWPVEEESQELRISERGKIELVFPPLAVGQLLSQSAKAYCKLAGAGFVLVSPDAAGFASGAALLFAAGCLRICAKYCCTYC